MATQEILIPEVGLIKVTKKRGMRSIRLRVTPKGDFAVSAPWYVPKKSIVDFVLAKQSWLLANQAKRKVTYHDGMGFGRDMELKIIENAAANRSRLHARELHVHLADEFDSDLKEQQLYIEKQITRALQAEAEYFLPPKLHELATNTGHKFNQVHIKKLTGRWGSCDSKGNIVLSLFLVQLPHELVEYVMAHELTHTKHMNHSASFWQHLSKLHPNYKDLRKQLRNYEPRVIERETANAVA